MAHFLAALTLWTAPALCLGETAVGLDALGVDAETALHNPHRLDLRDQLGRPVSSALVRRQLKEAGAEAAAQSAYASTAPQARAVLRLMALWATLGARIALPSPARPSQAAISAVNAARPQLRRPPAGAGRWARRAPERTLSSETSLRSDSPSAPLPSLRC